MAYYDLAASYADLVPATWGQHINDNFNYLATDRPQIAINLSSTTIYDDDPKSLTQSSPSGTSDLWSSGGSRLKLITDAMEGIYLITAKVIFQNKDDGNPRRYVRISVNDTDYIATRQGNRGLAGDFDTTITALHHLVKDDYIKVIAYHNEGVDVLCYGTLYAQLVAPVPV